MSVDATASPDARSGVILLRLPSWPATSGISRSIDAITAELADRGLTMVVHQAATGGSLRDVLDALSPDLVMTDAPLGPTDVEILRGERIAHMSLGIFDTSAPEVTLALWQAGHTQVSTLARLGHRHLVYVGHGEAMRRPFVMRRLGGARAAVSELAMAPIELREPPMDAEAIAADMGDWDNRVTGAVCYNDEVAALVVRAARIAGRSVPESLSVIGADDLPDAIETQPQITTVYTDLEVVARDYADAMCAKIGLPVPARESDERLSKLIQRGTIARAATASRG